MDSDYLGWVAKSEPFVHKVVARSVGVSYPAIKPSELVKLVVPTPSLPTQKHIARFLDEKTARLDALIEKKRALLARLAEKRQALITQAVTQGLDPDAPMKDSGIEWLGQIPAHWETKRLRYVARLASGSTPSKTLPEYWDGDIPWISPKDTKQDILTDSKDHVTQLAVDESRLRVFDRPNVVIVVRGMILARKIPVSVAKGTYTINQDMKALQSKGYVSPELLQMYLSSIESFLMTLVAEAGHGTKALRTDVLLDAPVLVPPAEEQISIVNRLSDAKAKFDEVIKKLTSESEVLLEYRSALITAAVTGQLDIPESANTGSSADVAQATLGTEVL